MAAPLGRAGAGGHVAEAPAACRVWNGVEEVLGGSPGFGQAERGKGACGERGWE